MLSTSSLCHCVVAMMVQRLVATHDDAQDVLFCVVRDDDRNGPGICDSMRYVILVRLSSAQCYGALIVALCEASISCQAVTSPFSTVKIE